MPDRAHTTWEEPDEDIAHLKNAQHRQDFSLLRNAAAHQRSSTRAKPRRGATATQHAEPAAAGKPQHGIARKLSGNRVHRTELQ